MAKRKLIKSNACRCMAAQEEQIKSCKELDALAAVYVMGWEEVPEKNPFAKKTWRDGRYWRHDWDPSANIHDRLKLQKRMILDGYELCRHRNPGEDGLWLVTIWMREGRKMNAWRAVHRDEGMAFCVACLASKGAPVTYWDGVRAV